LTGEFQRLTKTGEVFGSPVYMSPEQCTGRKLDQRTDVYSMGVVMYEGLSGRPPFKERTTIETIRKQIKEPAPKFSEVNPELKIPEQLENVILRCLTKNPDERYQTMEELRNELEAFAFNHNLRSPHISLSSTMPALNAKNASSGRLRAVGASQLAEPAKRIPPYTMAIILIVIVLLAFGAFKLLVR
jgi:serine/threonine protein kinase